MTDQPQFVSDRPDPSTIDLARERIRHVVVLMLENRSFDHLLGFSEIPGVTRLDPTEHVNRSPRSSTGFAPQGNGVGSFRAGPPHSHMAAMKQLGRVVRGKPSMDGFVQAYEEELAGRGFRPHFHWNRIWAAGIVLAVPVAAAGFDLAAWATDGKALAWWNFVLPAAVLAVAFGRPLGRASGHPALVGAVAIGLAVIGYAASEGFTRLVRDPGFGSLWWLLGAEIVVAGSIAAWRHVASKHKAEGSPADAADVMRCLPRGHLPVLETLAREFALCEGWFSSVPGATWPNRNFLHAGTSAQAVDIEIGFYDDRTLFELLDAGADSSAGAPWRIYSPDGSTPQVMCFEKLWHTSEQARNWRRMPDFEADALAGALPLYSFIEPAHTGFRSNSMHPGNNIVADGAAAGTLDIDRADELVRQIYEAIGARKDGWTDTMLVVTFDEHGGTFDRVPPPTTVPPDSAATLRHPVFNLRRLVAWFVENQSAPFNFRRYGVRVPTIVVSAWVEPQSVDRHIYDHTSVSETVRQLFAPKERPLSKRAKRARSFWDLVVGVATPRETIPQLPPSVIRGAPATIAEAGVAALESASSPGPATHPSDSTTGGDVADQVARLESLGQARLAQRGVSAPALAESGAGGDLVSQFRSWAESQPPGH